MQRDGYKIEGFFQAQMNREDFLFFKEKIFNLVGIHLSDNKIDLVQSRLKSHLEKNRITSYQEYRRMLEADDGASGEIQNFINLLTTNKTDFFREPKHFDYLIHDLIPYWKSKTQKTVKIWCCASSTGEEPYTIAMVLDRHLPKGMDFKILATDVDTKVLKMASNGVYSMAKFNEIPTEYQSLHLTQGESSASGWFRVSDALHSKIEFRQHNLIENTYPGDKIFDLIFCRNVLIYFKPETVRALMAKLHKSLKPDGTLFIGHSETLQGPSGHFKSIHPAIYKKIET